MDARPIEISAAGDEVVAVSLAGQDAALPALIVRDILGPQPVTPVPLAAAEVAGVLNLRGRIVTAIDLRRRLGIGPRAPSDRGMNVVIEHEGEFYSLIVDEVGEIFCPPSDRLERDLGLLGPAWREVSDGIYGLEQRLLVKLNVARILQFAAAL